MSSQDFCVDAWIFIGNLIYEKRSSTLMNLDSFHNLLQFIFKASYVILLR